MARHNLGEVVTERTEPGRQITVLVHGTFANPGYGKDRDTLSDHDRSRPLWWRPSTVGVSPTPADRLNSKLGRPYKVWDHRLHEGKSYEHLGEWSGLNTHEARLEAGTNLAAQLEEVATNEDLGGTKGEPLFVNYVAHSHGGNVVLESLKHHSADSLIKPRQIVMLGTPLTWRFTDMRFVYLMVVGAVVALTLSGGLFTNFGSQSTVLAPTSVWSLVARLATTFVLFPILLWFAYGVIVTLRTFSRRHLPGRPAYGPMPDQLVEQLNHRTPVLMISDQDEADLMMSLGAAPIKAYQALLVGRPAIRGAGFWKSLLILPYRVIEFVYLRPIVYVIIVPLVEVLLEMFGLGFPFRSVMVGNFEMVTWTLGKKETSGIKTVSVVPSDADQTKVQLARRNGAISVPTRRTTRSNHEMREIMIETFNSLRGQVRLAHTGYYTDSAVITKVAETINGPAQKPDTDGVSVV